MQVQFLFHFRCLWQEILQSPPGDIKKRTEFSNYVYLPQYAEENQTILTSAYDRYHLSKVENRHNIISF